MGNLSKGVTSESVNVDARCPDRNSLAEAQSLKPSPALSRGPCSLGIANAPSAITGVSLSNSPRVTDLNSRPSIRGFIGRSLAVRYRTQIGFGSQLKVTKLVIYPGPRKRSRILSLHFRIISNQRC